MQSSDGISDRVIEGPQELFKPLFRHQAGCWLHERWRTEFALRLPALASRMEMDWKWLCNRHERLLPGESDAVQCDWEDSSFLTVARFFPRVGGRLLASCLREWPMRFAESPPAESFSGEPEISVIFPVGGEDRIPLFRCVLRAFYAQTVKQVEFIAVEYGEAPAFRAACQEPVRYLFLRRGGGQFNKSRALNEGVRAARAPVVLLHDADVVPPVRLLESILDRIRQGWGALRPIRLLFMLDKKKTEDFSGAGAEPDLSRIEQIQANNPGLCTAVGKETYWQIGGHDERFEGWGGEDREFLDRLNQIRLYPGSFSPAVHLWHSPAAQKACGHYNRDLTGELRRIPAAERIRELNQSRSAREAGT